MKVLSMGHGDVALNMLGRENWDYLDIRPLPNLTYVCDCSEPMPFIKNETYDEIFASQIIEHIKKEKILSMLIEWKRILKMEGKLTIICPDALKSCKGFIEGKNSIIDLQALLLGDTSACNGYGVHYTLFDIEYLTEILISIGYKDIKHFDTYEYFLHLEALK